MDITNLNVNVDFFISISGAKSFGHEFKLASVPSTLLPHINVSPAVLVRLTHPIPGLTVSID